MEQDPACPGGLRVVLRGRVTVTDASEFKRMAVAMAAGSGPVTVDCTAATQLDGAVVQVLVALGRQVEGSGRRCLVIAGDAAGLLRLAGIGGIVSG